MRDIDYSTVPVSYMAEGMQRYIEHGIEPGGFMRALLMNDLRETVTRADAMNLVNIPHWVVWLENNVPGAAWGSPDRYNAWVDGRGVSGAFVEAGVV